MTSAPLSFPRTFLHSQARRCDIPIILQYNESYQPCREVMI
jgi:hypothetical protein